MIELFFGPFDESIEFISDSFRPFQCVVMISARHSRTRHDAVGYLKEPISPAAMIYAYN